MTQSEAIILIAQLFEESPERLSPETARDEIPAWDSLGVLTLLASLDRDFGIQLTDGEVEGMRKIDDVLEILRRNGKLTT